MPALSNDSYSSKILALYDAEYVRDRAFAGTSGSGTWLLELTGGGLLARPLRTRFLLQILPHKILTERAAGGRFDPGIEGEVGVGGGGRFGLISTLQTTRDAVAFMGLAAVVALGSP